MKTIKKIGAWLMIIACVSLLLFFLYICVIISFDARNRQLTHPEAMWFGFTFIGLILGMIGYLIDEISNSIIRLTRGI